VTEQALVITLWVASGAFIGGVVTPLIVQNKRVNNWLGMWAGVVVGIVGNVIFLFPLWLLLSRVLPDSPDRPSWKRDTADRAEVRAAVQPFERATPHAAPARPKSAPSPYVVVFFILALFTAMEAGVTYLPHLPEGVRVGVLGFLAATKVSLVLLYFMHLRSDYRVYALPFAIGLVLVLPLVLIVGLTTGETSAPAAGPSEGTPPASATSAPGGQAQLVSEGQQLFSEYCSACHGQQPGVAPAFPGMAGRAATRVSGQTAEQYIHESIENPSAYVVPGYQDIMPKDFGQKFSAEQINALVAYIMADSGTG
jgi:mono/diheme cytochrome c family protein